MIPGVDCGVGAGVGDFFTDVFGAIAQRSQDGSGASGDIADWLFGLGYTAAAVSQALDYVSQTAQATPAMRAYAQQERAYLGSQYNSQGQTNLTPILLLAAVGVLLWSSRD